MHWLRWPQWWSGVGLLPVHFYTNFSHFCDSVPGLCFTCGAWQPIFQVSTWKACRELWRMGWEGRIRNAWHTLPSRPGSFFATPWEFVVVADCSANMSTTSTLQAPETTSNPFSQVGWEELSCGICTIRQCQWFPALPSRSSKKQYGCRGKAPECQNLGLKEGNAKELVLPLSFLK